MLVSMKAAGPVNGAIDVALGGKMQNTIGLFARDHSVDASPVADVDLMERVTGDIRDRRQ